MGFQIGICSYMGSTAFEREFIYSYTKCRLFLLLVKLVVGKLLRYAFALVVCSSLELNAQLFSLLLFFLYCSFLVKPNIVYSS